MSNVNSPFGFKPIATKTGGAIPAPRPFVLTTGSTLYIGDPVIKTSAGTVSPSAAGQTTAHLGICASYCDDSASAAGKVVYVYTDPNILYAVQVGTGVTCSSQTYVFNTADHITYATGSTTTYNSVMALDTIGTSMKPWEILGLYDDGKNAWGSCCIVIVQYNPSCLLGLATPYGYGGI